MGDHGEIMRDEQIGEAVLALQVDQQVDHLGLDRHIERRHRLVARRSASARATAPARCRCAAAGRRRTDAGSCCIWSGRRPTCSNSSATRSRLALPAAMPWTLSGSPTISPAVMRGLSEANGSWKMICIARRIRAQLGLAETGDVRAVRAGCCRWSARPGAGCCAPRLICRSRTRRQGPAFRRAERETDAVDRMHECRPGGAARRRAPDNA